MIQHSDSVPFDGPGDDGDRAAWLLSLVDSSPDQLAVVEIPRTNTEEQLDVIEGCMRIAFNLAKEQRPRLVVKLLPPIPEMLAAGHDPADVALLFVIHEHQPVAGECVHCAEAVA
jgi:hypothetical protein